MLCMIVANAARRCNRNRRSNVFLNSESLLLIQFVTALGGGAIYGTCMGPIRDLDIIKPEPKAHRYHCGKSERQDDIAFVHGSRT